MAKPLRVDEIWLERIAELLDDMEFGSLHIVVHEGQIVQMERTERKRFENGNANGTPNVNAHYSGETGSRRTDARSAGRG